MASVMPDTWGSDDVPPPANALGRYGDAQADVAPVMLFLAGAEGRLIIGSGLPPMAVRSSTARAERAPWPIIGDGGDFSLDPSSHAARSQNT